MEMDFEKICRTCLSSDCPLVSIFENNVTDLSESESSSVIDLLTTLTDIKISANPGLPDHVCSTCVDELKRFYSFKLKCEKSETVLIKYLEDKHNYLCKNTISCSRNDIQYLDVDMDSRRGQAEADRYESETRDCPKTSNIQQSYVEVICVKEEDDEVDNVVVLSEEESSRSSELNTLKRSRQNESIDVRSSFKKHRLSEASRTTTSEAMCSKEESTDDDDVIFLSEEGHLSGTHIYVQEEDVTISSEKQDYAGSSRVSLPYSDAICLKEENIDDVVSFSSDCESNENTTIQTLQEISDYDGTDVYPQKESDPFNDIDDNIEVHGIVQNKKHEMKQEQCPACSLVCKNKVDLLQHLVSCHTDEKSCKICEKDYKYPREHIKTHMMGSYFCPICEVAVKQRRYLFRHMRRKHKIKEAALFLDEI